MKDRSVFVPWGGSANECTLEPVRSRATIYHLEVDLPVGLGFRAQASFLAAKRCDYASPSETDHVVAERTREPRREFGVNFGTRSGSGHEPGNRHGVLLPGRSRESGRGALSRHKQESNGSGAVGGAGGFNYTSGADRGR